MIRDGDRWRARGEGPEQACARDWRPVEAPAHGREPKCEGELVQWSVALAPGVSSRAFDPKADPDLEPDPSPDLDPDSESESGSRGESDGGGRHG